MEAGHEFEGSVIVHMEEREEGWEEGQEGWKKRGRKEGRVGGVFNNLLVLLVVSVYCVVNMDLPRADITPSWRRLILAQELGDPLSGGASLVADSWLCTVPVPGIIAGL